MARPKKDITRNELDKKAVTFELNIRHKNGLEIIEYAHIRHTIQHNKCNECNVEFDESNRLTTPGITTKPCEPIRLRCMGCVTKSFRNTMRRTTRDKNIYF